MSDTYLRHDEDFDLTLITPLPFIVLSLQNNHY